jgi:hypothetical protein
LVLANLRNCSPSLCSFITLILNHVSVSVFSYLCLSCISLACLTLVTPSPYSCVVDLSTYVILSFCFILFFTPIVFLFSSSRQTEIFFSPPRVLSPIFSLSTFYPTLHLPDLLQPACFSACLSLLCVSLCPSPSGTARVSLSV